MCDEVGWTFLSVIVPDSIWHYFFHSIEAELEYLKIAEDLEMYGISYFQIRVSDVHLHTTCKYFRFLFKWTFFQNYSGLDQVTGLSKVLEQYRYILQAACCSCHPSTASKQWRLIRTTTGFYMAVESLIFTSVVVLKESPCPRGFLRTNFQVLVLALGAQVLVLESNKSLSLSSSSEVQVLENLWGLSRLSVSGLCAGVSARVAMM